MMTAQDFIQAHKAWLLLPEDISDEMSEAAKPPARYASLEGAEFHAVGSAHADLRYANLSGAVLRNASLSGADLQHADFTGADITGARFSGARLERATGIRYAAIHAHWHGECGRQILAVDHGAEGVIVHCGCFRGTFDELGQYIEEGKEEYRASRSRAARMLREMIEDAP
jgi:hypothetical protein